MYVSYVAGSTPISAAVADLDGDGWLDVATANYYSSDVSILLNDAVWAGPGPGGAPGAGGGRGPSAPDLFLGEELARIASEPVHRTATLAALPDAGLWQTAAPVPSDPQVAPARTAGTSPAARRDRVHAVLEELFTPREEYGLPL
jgi:hypothetical protein